MHPFGQGHSSSMTTQPIDNPLLGLRALTYYPLIAPESSITVLAHIIGSTVI